MKLALFPGCHHHQHRNLQLLMTNPLTTPRRNASFSSIPNSAFTLAVQRRCFRHFTGSSCNVAKVAGRPVSSDREEDEGGRGNGDGAAAAAGVAVGNSDGDAAAGGVVIGDSLYPLGTVALSRAVALLHGECMTAWNIRKQLLQDGSACVACELHLTNLALDIRPKSPEVFIHKRYILTRYFSSSGDPHTDSYSCPHHHHSVVEDAKRAKHHDRCTAAFCLVNDELRLCLHSAERYRHNYAAWQHRAWLLHRILTSSSSLSSIGCCCCCPASVLTILDAELECVDSWTALNVSQHSAMSYLLHLMHLICHMTMVSCLSSGSMPLPDDHQRRRRTQLLSGWLRTRLENCTSLMTMYTEHEALWTFRRGLVGLVLSHVHHQLHNNTATRVQTGGASAGHTVACHSPAAVSMTFDHPDDPASRPNDTTSAAVASPMLCASSTSSDTLPGIGAFLGEVTSSDLCRALNKTLQCTSNVFIRNGPVASRDRVCASPQQQHEQQDCALPQSPGCTRLAAAASPPAVHDASPHSSRIQLCSRCAQLLRDEHAFVVSVLSGSSSAALPDAPAVLFATKYEEYLCRLEVEGPACYDVH
ncbi:uncharacterized protein LOC135825705 isoform X2 [Sycon ciliatum]|uniref:uncharacterized protein LOC135825705 isoform X2 n=1 Tax=Sycon ciliatum TaxID=27933 RepID=UPI0031F6DA2B